MQVKEGKIFDDVSSGVSQLASKVGPPPTCGHSWSWSPHSGHRHQSCRAGYSCSRSLLQLRGPGLLLPCKVLEGWAGALLPTAGGMWREVCGLHSCRLVASLPSVLSLSLGCPLVSVDSGCAGDTPLYLTAGAGCSCACGPVSCACQRPTCQQTCLGEQWCCRDGYAAAFWGSAGSEQQAVCVLLV